MTNSLARLIAAWLLTTLTVAQNHITIPQSAEARDGTGVGSVPGFERVGRQQFLIGQSELSSAVGRRLNALTFRRDGFEPARTAGQADLSIWLSVSPLTDVRAASPIFADNRGTAALVFAGRIELPASPRLLDRHAAAWSTPDAVTITLHPPWQYLGGNLCIEILGQPVPGAPTPRFWSVDVETDAVRGQRTTLGTGCGPMAARVMPQASVDPAQLRPGATARFTCAGDAGATAFFMLAAVPLPTPINLALVGAPGCELWLLPDIMLPSAIGAANGQRPPATRLDLTLPALSSLIGGSFATQWMMFGASGLTTSNALQVVLAGVPLQVMGSIVQAGSAPGQDRTLGLVQVGALPVIRLHW